MLTGHSAGARYDGCQPAVEVRVVKTFLLILPICLLLVLALYYAVVAWNSVPGGQMSVHGYVAMFIGVILTLILAAGLIRLLLRDRPEDAPSDRE